ncbi:MAG TPA: TlpA disulfide reductase family protein [Polyangiaceae bacterium]
MSSLTIAKRFFASAALCALAGGCRCSDEGRPDPAARAGDETANETPEEASPDEAAPDETEPSPESAPAGSAAAPGALEVVTAEALIAKLKASGRKGTLVNAWASFCGPCKREIPMLEALAKKLRPRGLDVVLVSVDEPDDRAKADAFLRELGTGLTSYLAARPLGAFKRGMNPRWPGMLPASFLFDAEGVLRYYWGGEAFEPEVVPVLDAFLAGQPLPLGEEFTPPVAPGN